MAAVQRPGGGTTPLSLQDGGEMPWKEADVLPKADAKLSAVPPVLEMIREQVKLTSRKIYANENGRWGIFPNILKAVLEMSKRE